MSGTGEKLRDKKPGGPQHQEGETQILTKEKSGMRGQPKAMAEREAFPKDMAGEAQEVCCWTEGEL